jgi:hypothetical protein
MNHTLSTKSTNPSCISAVCISLLYMPGVGAVVQGWKTGATMVRIFSLSLSSILSCDESYTVVEYQARLTTVWGAKIAARPEVENATMPHCSAACQTGYLVLDTSLRTSARLTTAIFAGVPPSFLRGMAATTLTCVKNLSIIYPSFPSL